MELNSRVEEYKQALEKIKDILKWYSTSTIGTRQPDGTYKLVILEEQNAPYVSLKAQEGLDIIDELKNN